MKRLLIITVLLSLVFSCSKSNQKENKLSNKNTLVTNPIPDEVKIQFMTIISYYTRKLDLVSGLVNVVITDMKTERSLLENVIKSRSSLLINIPTNIFLDKKKMSFFESNEKKFSTIVNHVILEIKKYPKLQRNQNYLEIINQLKGTKNRIMIEKNKFNKILDKYNLNYPKFNLNTKF